MKILSDFNPKGNRARYLVRGIFMSEMAFGDADQQAFIEAELERLTGCGEEVVAILPDREDFLVVLKVSASGGAG